MFNQLFEISGFFIIGLSGGFGHCVLMCNPLVIYISSKFMGAERGYKLLVPHFFYNIGRIVTYTALGALAGFLGGVVQYAGEFFMNIQRLAAILGGFFMLLYAFFTLFKYHTNLFANFNYLKYFKKIEPNHPFLYGVMFGFLPCGLSMGAVIGASSAGNFLTGGLMMTAFGLGTSVAMMLMAVFGSVAMRYSNVLRTVGAVFLMIMGAYFIYTGISY